MAEETVIQSRSLREETAAYIAQCDDEWAGEYWETAKESAERVLWEFIDWINERLAGDV